MTGINELTNNGTVEDLDLFPIYSSDNSATRSVSWATMKEVAPGIPVGGTTGQQLTKNSDDDYDAVWSDAFDEGRVRSYATLALAIADTDLELGDSIITLGYTSQNDGGGGRYVVVAGATGTDNGGLFLDMTNGLQLELIVRGNVEFRQFGAVGNGSADDTIITETAFNSGVPIFVSDGVYLVDRARVTTTCAISGSGAGAVFKQKPDAVSTGSKAVLEFDGITSFSTVSGISIDGNKTGIPNTDPLNCEGINVKNCQNVHISDVAGKDVKSELLDWDTSEDCSGTRINGVDCGGMVIHISTDCKRVVSRDSSGIRCGIDNERPAFDIFGASQDSTIENCSSFECFAGFNVYGDSNRVTGFTAIDCQEWGFQILGDKNVLSCISIIGANLVSGGISDDGTVLAGNNNVISALSITGVLNGKNMLVSGSDNVVSASYAGDCPADGISFTSGSARNDFSDFKIDGCISAYRINGTGNVIRAGRSANSRSDSFLFTGDNCRGYDCISDSAGGDAAEIDGTNTAIYNFRSISPTGAGYRVESTAIDAKVIGCESENPGSVDITDSGTNTTIKGGKLGLGGNLKFGATKSSDGFSTMYTVDHGLGITPTYIDIQPTSTDAAAFTFVSARSGATFQVTFLVAPPSGTGNLTWDVEVSKEQGN